MLATSRHGALAVTVALADPGDVGPTEQEHGLIWCARLEDPPDRLRHVRAGYGPSEQAALDALRWACERASQGHRGLGKPG